MRASLVERLAPLATAAHREISTTGEHLELSFSPGNSDDFARDLTESYPRESRLRQTVVGPHRDDIQVLLETRAASQYASEGQQRTIALAMKLAQSHVFTNEYEEPPLLLIDDVFGELDPTRRNSLLSHLPSEGQKLVTATTMQWLRDCVEGPITEIQNGSLCRTN
jgi:DNA replication and repair protein RecF